MLRVGVDARPLHYPQTGIGQYTTNILRHFREKPDIDLYLYSRDALLSIEQYSNKTRHSSFNWVPNFLLAQLMFPLWARADRLDVFWSPRHHVPLAINCPSVVTIHDMVWLKHPDTMTFGGAALERLLMPPSIRKANAIICVSEATRGDVEQHSPQAASKCEVILEAPCQVPDGTDYSSSEHPFFLMVGTKEPRKNLDVCLEAWKLSRLADQGYRLVLAGGRGWKYELLQRIERLGLEGSVIDAHPDAVELRKLYAQCYAVILPSIYEGFGLPLVEGMAFGKPLITSNVSSMPEIAGDAALLLPPDQPEKLADAFNRLASDKALHADLSEKSARRAGQFNWATAADRTLEVLKAVAAN